jgi:Ca-activated chloride channel family protein
MNREQAEKLLAALIFDDLDETSKAELMAYLQTDDELRDRLADLRMAVKLADDAVNEGPDPVLHERRLNQLRRLAKAGKTQTRVFSIRRVLAVAAVLIFSLALLTLLVPPLEIDSGTLRSLSGVDALRGRIAGVRRYPAAASVPSEKESAAAASRPATRAAPSGPVASAGRRYSMDAGQTQYGMGGMGGYGGAGGMSGREVAKAPSNVLEHERIARAFTGLRDQQPALRQLSPPPAPMSSRAPAGALPGSVESPAIHNSPVRGPMVSAKTSSMSAGYGSTPKEEVAKEVNGDAAASNLRLHGDLGQKLTDADMYVMKGQVSSSQSGRGNTPAEPPTKADGVANYNVVVSAGWSGTVTPEKSAAPVVPSAPSDSAVAFDKEVGQRFGINGSVKDEKSVPILGDVAITGGLFRSTSSSENKAESESLIEGRAREEDSPEKSSIQANSAPAQRGPEPTGQPGLVAAEDGSGLPTQSHFRVVPVNPWVMTERDAFSTFGLDVDTASYALCRRYIRGGFLPPVGAVRMEEFINAFDYAYPQRDDATFAVHAEGAPSPFAPPGQDLVLLKVAVKARTVGRDQRRAANLIFVVDASASMGQADRLPLVQSVSNRLADKLADVDRVSLITCANEARLHLEAVSARQKDTIHQTINAIQPGGPTNLLAGLKLGYEMARKSFVAGQTNQVVLCSDGVANVGQTEAEEMLKEVAEDRKQAITLTCVGVGYGAYNDAFLEALADQGDGRYVFLDSSEQAQDALVEQLAGSLQNVATDARIQVQFDPAQVRRYRLIGYENRDIEDQRFRDDTVEAGAVGSGQCSTALYELELTGPPSVESEADLGTVFVRYRNTDTGQIEEISRPLANSLIRRRSVEDDPRFFLAAGAARFAEWLRQSEHARQTSLSDVQRLLDRVSAALPLDRQVRDLAALAHQAEGLPRAPQAATEPAAQP